MVSIDGRMGKAERLGGGQWGEKPSQLAIKRRQIACPDAANFENIALQIEVADTMNKVFLKVCY